ncbi:uncharacterized protein FFB14_10690 [Fusarium fujikuroi]|nr:uncharacterized protein FFB14_10690 [Fusarium fujikuroi]
MTQDFVLMTISRGSEGVSPDSDCLLEALCISSLAICLGMYPTKVAQSNSTPNVALSREIHSFSGNANRLWKVITMPCLFISQTLNDPNISKRSASTLLFRWQMIKNLIHHHFGGLVISFFQGLRILLSQPIAQGLQSSLSITRVYWSVILSSRSAVVPVLKYL